MYIGPECDKIAGGASTSACSASVNIHVIFIISVMMKPVVLLVLVMAAAMGLQAQESIPGTLPSEGAKGGSGSAFVIARLKYSGGGDWYNDPSSEVNMLEYLRKHTGMNVRPSFEYVDLATDNIFSYPLLFLTGHGNITFSDGEAKRLRAYLDRGGFLYIDDDYGLDTAIRREMRKVFSGQEFREIPFSHPIYNSFFNFPHGLPKIHEHDKKAPQGLGLFTNDNRLCVFYTFETNPSDGWADPEAHNDPPERRETSFKIGTNIIVYALTN